MASGPIAPQATVSATAKVQEAARRARRNNGVLKVDFSTRFEGPAFRFAEDLH